MTELLCWVLGAAMALVVAPPSRIFLRLVAEPARPAEGGAGCLFGPAGLGRKILKYQTFTQFYPNFTAIFDLGTQL